MSDSQFSLVPPGSTHGYQFLPPQRYAETRFYPPIHADRIGDGRFSVVIESDENDFSALFYRSGELLVVAISIGDYWQFLERARHDERLVEYLHSIRRERRRVRDEAFDGP